jgi:hypothetical protein
VLLALCFSSCFCHFYSQYYHNASADQVATVKNKARTAAMQEQAPEQQDPEEGGEEEYEEEEYEEEEYVEEYEAPAPAVAASNLQDLQAILAAKQAELMRLQGLQ